MEYQILDASGQDVDKTVRMVNRDDLYKTWNGEIKKRNIADLLWNFLEIRIKLTHL